MAPASVGDSWRTPPEILDIVRAYSRLAGYGPQIGLDPCGGQGSLVDAKREIRLPADGLAEDWATDNGVVFVNPPYSKVRPWIDKCAKTGEHTDVIALVNVATSERWWRWPDALCFLIGRVKFLDPAGKSHHTNTRPSALLYWGDRPELFEHVSRIDGRVWRL